MEVPQSLFRSLPRDMLGEQSTGGVILGAGP